MAYESRAERGSTPGLRVAHLTTVDSSLRYLLLPQLLAVIATGGQAIGISAKGIDAAYLESRGIRHIALPGSTRGMHPIADLRAAIALWVILRRERPDVLHTHNPKPGLYGRIVGRLAGVPVVVNTVHGLYATATDRWLKRLVVYALEAIASRFSDAELVQSAEDHRLLTRWRISPPRRTTLLGNGIDLTRFRQDGTSAAGREAIRASLGIPRGRVTVGTVGRLVSEKGYAELIAAAEILGDDFAILVVGPEDPDKHDALSPSLLERARTAGVRLLGQRDDVHDLYRAMDIFVLASHREGMPRAAMEASASGLAVVATDIRGCREVIDDGVTGLLVPPKDVEALVGAIGRLARDAGLRRRMGAAGAQRAQLEFDEERVIRVVLETYERVARGKGQSRGYPTHLRGAAAGREPDLSRERSQ
jgi:glycosyltransferase involved in cell wall biosynthesis